MPITTQNVPVPIDGGLGQSRDEWAVAPPKLLEAQNVVVRRGGALEKLSGGTEPPYQGLALSHGNGKAFFVPRADRDISLVAPSGTTVFGETRGWTTPEPGTTPGHHAPVGVRLYPVDSPRGAVSDVNLCHMSGYTALVYQVAETDYNAVSIMHGFPVAPPGTEGETVTARCLIVDEEGTVVWGPYDVPQVRHFPRVEACLKNVSLTEAPNLVANFVFTGVTGHEDSDFSPFADDQPGGTFAGATELWGFAVDVVNLSAPSPVVFTDLGGHGAGTASYVYDTHSHPELTYCLIAYRNTSHELVWGTYVGSGLVDVETAPGAADSKNYAIFYESNSNTVLVYRASNATVYAWGTDPSTYTTHVGAGTWELPVFYLDSPVSIGDAVTGTSMAIAIAGSSPGTPSFSGVNDAPFPSGLIRPQYLADIGPVFFQRQDADFFSIAQQTRGIFLDVIRVAPDAGPDSTDAYVVAPLTQGWASAVRNWGFHTLSGSVGAWGTVPQSSRDSSGRVLVPVVFDPPGGAAYLEGYRDRPRTYIIDKGHAGPLNSDVQVGVARISTVRTELDRSVVQYRGTAVLAAGDVSTWDGQKWAPLTPTPPVSLSYDATITAATYQERQDYSTLPFAGITGSEAYSYVRWWAMRVVFVYTDANGIEYRSAPSRATTAEDIPGNIDDPCPRLSFTLEPHHRRFLDNGGNLDVELYVTQRWNGTSDAGAATEDEIIEEYFLAQRTPLQEDATGFFIPDFLRTENSAAPLFTDSGELPPDRPAASSVLAAAGNYMFLLPSEFPDQFWPSKPLASGRGPEFSLSLIGYAPPDSGGIVSLAGQGDRLVLLCKRGLWEVFVGQSGPDATGAGSFSPPRLLHAGDGCVTHRGTVSGPFGVFYVSASGPKILAPDGSVLDVGEDVADLFDPDGTIDAVYHDAHNEVWLFQDSGEHLILSVDSGVWTSTTLDTYAAAVHRDKLWRYRSTSNVVRETPGTALDDGDIVSASVTTPWLTFGGPMGWKRARRIGVLLRKTSGTIGAWTIKVAYDYVDTVVDTFTFEYHEVSGVAKPFQFRVRPSRQKFDSLRITVADDTSLGVGVGTPPFEGDPENDLLWTLVGVEVEVAAKSGIVKLQEEASQ